MSQRVVDGRYVEVITRGDDRRCEEGMAAVLRAAARLGVAVHTVDVATDRALQEEFADRLPVVRAPDGAIIDEGEISVVQVTAALVRITGAAQPKVH